MQLDTSVYDHIARPRGWLESYAQMTSEVQVRVSEALFVALSPEEQQFVVGTTFM